MNHVITFIINIPQFILRNQLKFFFCPILGKNVSDMTGMIIYPKVSVIITNDFTFFNIEVCIHADPMQIKIIVVNSRISQYYPLIL